MGALNPYRKNQLNKFKMNRVLICFFVLIFFSFTAQTQTIYSLQQCIDLALKNNIPVKQSALDVDAARVNWKQSKMNLLPTLGMDVSHGLNTGRSIDPFTNAYVNQSVSRAGYGAATDLVLFKGGSLQNRIKENATAYEASKMEWQQSKDNLVLNVILAYLSVLNNEDRLQVAYQQASTTQAALDRLQILNSQGAVKPSDVSDLKGQLMNDQLSILDAKNQLESSKLLLTQWMNRPYDSALRLERMGAEEFLSGYDQTANDVYQNSLNQFSLVKAVEMRKRSSEYSLKAARGQMFPTLSFGAGINTNYSSVARDANNAKIPYSNQLKNNRFTSFGVGLNIPIFNSSFARNRVKLSEINLKSSELTELETKRLLHQQIDQAYLNMNNAYERYKVLLSQVTAYEESFKAAEIRFKAGVGTSVDYLTAKDRLDRANINLVNAKYDFVLRKKVLDYYNGKNQ
jgi:outer membrane protein